MGIAGRKGIEASSIFIKITLERMVIKVKYIDLVIWILLVFLLLVDTLNGILDYNGILLPISVSQIYKLGVVFLLLFRLIVTPTYLKYIFGLFALLILPSIYSFALDRIGIGGIIQDVIKVFKYLTIAISFYYFKMIFETSKKELFNHYVFWIKVSFWIVAINLCLKFVGLGIPMYVTGNIGSKGYFIAGNEISALLLILSGFLGYYYLVIQNRVLIYIFYGISSLLLGFLISSKTSMMGVFLIQILILLGSGKLRLNNSKRRGVIKYLIGVFILICVGIVFFIRNSAIYERYTYFWHKMDILTFVLSSRNLFFKEMLVIFSQEYSLIDKLIGVGNYHYEQLASKIIEIDVLDLFFSNGYLGVFVFIILLLLLYLQIRRNSKRIGFPYARLSILMLILLGILSCMSGHIFNSGLSGIYTGFIFALSFKEVTWNKG